MIKRHRIPVVLFACFICTFVSGQLFLRNIVLALDSTKPITQFVHDAWQTDQGLPQNSVVSIAQTRDGYIWLATQEGLVRFDGVRFTVFDKRNVAQIKENVIQVLYEGREGSLWAGTEGGGLMRLKDGRFTVFTTDEGLPDNIVDSVYEDHENSLWVGTPEGLTRFKDGEFKTYTVADGLLSNTVLAIYEDHNGALWVGTDGGGISKLKDNKFTSFTTKEGLIDDIVRAIVEDRAGNLWIGTKGGLNRFKNGSFATYTTKDGLTNNSILSVYEDTQGTIWVGTDGGGLNRIRDGRITHYMTKDGLSDDGVAAIYEDREGILWVGTYGGGLNRMVDSRFSTYTIKEGLSDNMARSICEDRDGAMWIATRNGLNRLKDGKLSLYTTKDGLANNSTLSLFEDREGVLWVGTRGGLNRMKKGIASYTTKDGLSDDTVLAITEARDESLWVGTASGLNQFKNGKFKVYGAKDGFTDSGVWALCEDDQRGLWVGTDGSGLYRFKDGEVTGYTVDNGLANDIVMALYEDKDGALWIGTSGGLSRLKGQRVTTYTTKDGLPDEVIFQILEDDTNNLWMSCNKGVFRLKKDELNDFAEGRRASITSAFYDTTDGMQSRECNGGFQPAGWKAKDGKLWFPTIKGVAVIDPANLMFNNLPPPVIVEQVIADNESIDPLQETRFAPGKNKLEFYYTGLSFVAPQKMRFKYKLEGFDKDWIDAGTKREAVYTNIPPGHYTFRVMAANNDGVWNEEGASFDFHLQPRFYQTYWFYGLCVVFVTLLIFGAHRYRVRQVEARYSAVIAERNRIAREIHDTLAQGFVAISAQLETAVKLFSSSPERAIKHMDQARILVRSSIAEARRSVLDLRSQDLESGDLVSALSDTAKRLMARAPIDLEVKGARRRLAPDVENNLLRIGQEALTNAVRHSEAQRIDVELLFDPEFVKLCVKDDGRGFNFQSQLETNGGRLGLQGMRERAKQIGAEWSVRSAPDFGTEVTVRVPSET